MQLSVYRPERDATELRDLLAGPGMLDYLYPGLRRPPSIDDVSRDWCTPPHEAGGDCQWVVRLECGEAVGCIRLETCELSFLIGQPFQNRGLATQALTLTKERLRVKGAQPLYAYADRRNVPSSRVLERTGFVFMGLIDKPGSPNRVLAYCLSPQLATGQRPDRVRSSPARPEASAPR
jgi:RimJ/RimL family protein N-acetyltransferase